MRRIHQTNCKLMILLSSTVYDILLKVVHGHVVTSSASTSVAESLGIDGDDVYFRFGGAILSEMLHLRYKNKCVKSSSKISQEITILQAINTKEESSMPKYLRYQDRCYIYTPHPSFHTFYSRSRQLCKGKSESNWVSGTWT